MDRCKPLTQSLIEVILIYEERENDTGSRLQLLSLRSTCLKESLCVGGQGCSICIGEVCVYVCGLCERHLCLSVCARGVCLMKEKIFSAVRATACTH